MNDIHLHDSLKVLETPSILVGGDHGSGKTNFLLHILNGIVKETDPQAVELLLVSPTGDLTLWHEIPHLVSPILRSRNLTVWALEHLLTERMNARGKLPRLIVMIDEIQSFMVAGHSRNLERLVAFSHFPDAQVSFILTTSCLLKPFLPDSFLQQIPIRVCFKVQEKEESELILGVDEATKLRTGEYIIARDGDLMKRECDVIDKDVLLHAIESCDHKQVFQPGLMKVLVTPLHAQTKVQYDSKYDEAVKIVRKYQVASASFLQRRLGLGYNRAANLIELMEENGVVSPSQGCKPRKIF